MNHTKGPWKVYHENGSMGSGGHWGVESDKKTIAIMAQSHLTPGPEARANARLIAVAPVMYDLLIAAVARVSLANNEGNPILSAWLVDAQAAIKATEGGK